MTASSTALIVFARAPQAGKVKTRLIPAIGEQGALELYRRMLEHALRIASECHSKSESDELILACTPDTSNDELQELARRFGAHLQVQTGDDLGARMHHALSDALQRHERALLIGSDCPSLTRADLCEAKAALGASAETAAMHEGPCAPQAVFCPARDGGYVLVGLSSPCPVIFDDMPWGSNKVMKLTRARLLESGSKWLELQVKDDVDEPGDLAHLPPGFR